MVLVPGLIGEPVVGSAWAGPKTPRPPATKRAGGRLLATVAILVTAAGGVLLGPATPALAHAQLAETTPANGERLDSPPAEVTLRFTERVNLVRDGIRLLDASGKVRNTQPARLDAATPTVVHLPVPTDLGDGVYTVTWRVVSADSHPIHGAFLFGVGDVVVTQLPDSGALTGADPPLAAVFWLLRWLGYAALALFAGGATFLLLCWPAGATQRRARRMLLGGWVGGLAGAIGVLFLQGPYAAGRTLAGLADLSLLRTTIATDFGRYVLARIALHLVAGVLVWWLAGKRGLRLPGLAVVAALALLDIALPATWVGTGHANAEASLVAAAADAVHVGAMAAWFGGLALLGTCLLPNSANRPVAEIAAAVPRFSRIATVSVVAIVSTGIYQAWRGVGSLSAISGSTYGSLLVFKLAAVGVLLWLGVISRSVVRRHYPLRPAVAAAVTANGDTANGDTANGDTANGGTANGRTANGRTASGDLVSDQIDRGDQPDTDKGELDRRNGRAGAVPARGMKGSHPSVRAQARSGPTVKGGSVMVANRSASGGAVTSPVAGTRRIKNVKRTNAAGRANGPGSRTAASRTERVERELELAARQRLRWSVRFEALITIAILGLTSVLVATPPASRPDAAVADAAQPAPAPSVFNSQKQFDGGAVRVRLDPARVGPSALTIIVLDAFAASWDVPEVRAAIRMPAKEIGPLPVELSKTGRGLFESTGLVLPAAGTWRLTVRVRTSDFAEAAVSFDVAVS